MLRDATLGSYLDALASADATPGGGAATALSLAQAAALLCMVCRLTLGKPKFAEHDGALRRLLEDALAVKAAAERMADADTAVFKAYLAAVGLPKDTAEAVEARSAAVQAALQDAARVPLAVYELAGHLLAPNGTVQILLEIGNPSVISDVHVARFLAVAALQSAAANVQINLAMIKDAAKAAALRARLVHSADLSYWIQDAAKAPFPVSATGTRTPDPGAKAAVERILKSLPAAATAPQ
jgi:formiminotetrahydrofolate cyclodeaminase